jgi:hypothetical protein
LLLLLGGCLYFCGLTFGTTNDVLGTGLGTLTVGAGGGVDGALTTGVDPVGVGAEAFAVGADGDGVVGDGVDGFELGPGLGPPVCGVAGLGVESGGPAGLGPEIVGAPGPGGPPGVCGVPGPDWVPGPPVPDRSSPPPVPVGCPGGVCAPGVGPPPLRT